MIYSGPPHADFIRALKRTFRVDHQGRASWRGRDGAWRKWRDTDLPAINAYLDTLRPRRVSDAYLRDMGAVDQLADALCAEADAAK